MKPTLEGKLDKKANDPRLKNVIDQLYRPGSFIGDGGISSALKFEFATSIGLGRNGNYHTQKALDTIKYINNKILKQNTLKKATESWLKH